MSSLKSKIIAQINNRQLLKEGYYKEYNGNVIEKFFLSLKGFTNLKVLYGTGGSQLYSIKNLQEFIKKNPKDTKYYIWNYKLDKSQQNVYKAKLDKHLAPLVKKKNFCMVEKERNKQLYLNLQKPEDKEKKAQALAKFREYEALVPKFLKQLNDEAQKFDAKIQILSDKDIEIVTSKLESINDKKGFDIKELFKVLSSLTPIQKKAINSLYLGHQNAKTDATNKMISDGGSLD